MPKCISPRVAVLISFDSQVCTVFSCCIDGYLTIVFVVCAIGLLCPSKNIATSSMWSVITLTSWDKQ